MYREVNQKITILKQHSQSDTILIPYHDFHFHHSNSKIRKKKVTNNDDIQLQECPKLNPRDDWNFAQPAGKIS